MARSQTDLFYGIDRKKKTRRITRQQAARNFVTTWSDETRGGEDKDRQTFWIDLLDHVYGVHDYAHYLDFERDVLVNGNQKHIDVFIPSTKVMIEMKGRGKNLDDKIRQSDGIKLTPFGQAVRYSQHLPHKDNPRWIIVSNFDEMRIYDMNLEDPESAPKIIRLQDLPNKVSELEFLINVQQQNIIDEKQISVDAGNLVAKIYDELTNAYAQHVDVKDPKVQQSLNILIVRLVFLLYADDTGILGENDMFQRFMARRKPQDIRRDLMTLFHILNTTEAQRNEEDPFLDSEFTQFSYVNGGMFADENVLIPQFTQELKDLIVNQAGRGFNWSNISPTIFGAVFESTLNPETRRSGGMHYTSVENIHKVIDPLFLDDLNNQMKKIENMQEIKARKEAATEFQEKLGHLKFFDPACGSGNFLTETYLCLRRMENECLRIIYGDDNALATGKAIKVHIQNFYGIEINDFAVSVARTAMWIAESQMFEETKNIVYTQDDFLPLDSNDSIYEGNALRMDWVTIVKPYELDYIMGNPPFLGYKQQSADQKNDLVALGAKSKSIDYVSGWFLKAAKYIQGTSLKVAFVSTNSLCQGEEVVNVWEQLMNDYGVKIIFCYRSFVWSNEASDQAKVHVVIIGFSFKNKTDKQVFLSNGKSKIADNISPYLFPGPTIFIKKRTHPLCRNTQKMVYGSEPREGNNLILSDEEAEAFKRKYPKLAFVVRRYVSAKDFIDGNYRYCLWLKGVDPELYKSNTFIQNRLEKVRDYRENSKQKQAHASANTPYLFTSIRQPESDYLLFPIHSSQRRDYIPIGYVSKDVIASNACFTVPNATPYTFGVMTSKVHMVWTDQICGRIKSDYRYSNTLVYNNFPWPRVENKQEAAIAKTAQAILDARKLNPESSLAALYNPNSMTRELRKAHEANDKAVLKAYGLNPNATEEEIVQHLFKMYEELTSQEK